MSEVCPPRLAPADAALLHDQVGLQRARGLDRLQNPMMPLGLTPIR